jgi:hypothetical protein
MVNLSSYLSNYWLEMRNKIIYWNTYTIILVRLVIFQKRGNYLKQKNRMFLKDSLKNQNYYYLLRALRMK